ncbi:wax ester/triacylglycerol synthase domain-containing protein [Streptomyces enissocaesilis]|uniref:diacylglycerol O-acyltransferase n=1 Tax=Streptomyces enissocaesilis TaxID=332589 RepID=A0ABP6J4F0_9ACTN
MGTAAGEGSRALSTSEALLWQAETSGLRLPVIGVAELDGTPDLTALTAAVQRIIRHNALLRSRVTGPRLFLGGPRWEALDEVALSHHIRRTALPGAAGQTELLELAQAAATAPFDKNRPLWDVLLVERVQGDNAALVMRLHHAMVDGLRALELFSSLCDELAPPPSPNRLSLITQEQEVADSPLLDGRLPWHGVGAGAVRAGLRFLGSGVRHMATAGAGLQASRSALCLPADHSPALAGRSQDRRLLTLTAPKEQLRRAGRTVGGTTHDAFLAAVVGGLHHYHRAVGLSWDRVPMAVAVALPAWPGEARNRFTGVRLAGATGEEDVRRRLEQTYRSVRAARALPPIDPDRLGPLSPLLAAAPAKAVRVLTDLVTESDAHCTYVPGPDERRSIAGKGLTRLFAFAPVVNSALSVAMCSYDGTCAIGVNIDPRAVKDVELLHSSLRAGLDEVLSLGGR